MSGQTYPPGGTFFDTLKKNFNDVPIDASKGNAIATSDFLEAAESLTTLFGTQETTIRTFRFSLYGIEILSICLHVIDVLGSAAFTPVKSDMLGNIKVCAPPPTSSCGLRA